MTLKFPQSHPSQCPREFVNTSPRILIVTDLDRLRIDSEEEEENGRKNQSIFVSFPLPVSSISKLSPPAMKGSCGGGAGSGGRVKGRV